MAASNMTEKETHLKCPSCLVRLTDPMAFPCLHLFCQGCIDDMKPIKDITPDAIECPVCRQRTPKDSVQSIACVKDLLEIAQNDGKQQLHCKKCKKETPTWRCLDCKDNFCDSCRDHHNEFDFMKHHKWERLSAKAKPILDKHVYCQHPDHSGELVKLHCKDCNELICMLCNGTDHKKHEAETIAKASESALSSMKTNTATMAETVVSDKVQLDDLTKQGEETKKEYEEQEKKVDEKYAEVLRKAKEDYEKVKQMLHEKRDEDFKKIETLRKRIELDIQTKENTLVLSEITMNIAQGTSLLQLYQAVIRKSFDIHAAEKSDKKGTIDVYSTEFRDAGVSNDNTIGLIERSKQRKEIGDTNKNQNPPITSRFINQPLTPMYTMTTTLVKEITDLGERPKFEKIGDELWFLKHNTNRIDAYTLDGIISRTIQFKQIGNIRSFQKLSSGLALAAVDGLHIGDSNGNILSTIMSGDICDVSIMGDTLYALNNGRSKVCIWRQLKDEKAYIKQKEFIIQGYVKNQFNTIQVTADHIYVALFLHPSKIHQYTHDGTLKKEFESCNATIGQQIRLPKLCGASVDGSILIVRQSEEYRVIILTADCQWHSLPVTGLVSPYDAWVENSHLWVYDFGTRSCKQYELH